MPKKGPIIIVEDDEDDSELVKEIFKELQIPNHLHFFTSGKSALEYLLTTVEHPFLILSDINTPLMTGLDLLKSINDNPFLKNKAIPFIFLSTSSDSDVIAKAYQLSAHGFFVKPTSVAKLKEIMESILLYWNISSRPAA